nr:hypothetical protein [Sphingomonas sp.]
MRSLLRIWPDARFIVMLRDPLEMLPSLHQRLLYLGDEAETDFGAAWRLIGQRAAGRGIPRSCVDPRLLRYDRIGRLGEHVCKFLDVVGDHRCLVILHEDLAADCAGVYRRVQQFVGLTPVEPPERRIHRESFSYRIGWLQRLLYRPPIVTRALVRRANNADAVISVRNARSSSIGRAARKLRRQLVRWNRVPAPPPFMPPDVRAEICDLFADDIARLSVRIDRDLGHWLDGAVGARMPPIRDILRRTG